MNLEYIKKLLNQSRDINELGNPTIKICVDGELAEIEEVSYDELEDCLVIHDGSFDPETTR